MTRERPLWQMDVISDIGDGRAAVVAKVHHSIMDGAAAVGILGALFDLEPRVPAGGGVEPPDPTPARSLGVRPAVRSLLRTPAVTVRTVAQIPRAALGFARALRKAGRSVALPLSGPRTSLNRSITWKRDVALATLSLTDVREVAESFELTVNDVLTAVSAGALRTWLQDAGELPARPLVAAVPVALREGDPLTANRLSVMFASVPTHLADAADRLEAVKTAMRDAKATHADVQPQTLGALADAAPWNLVGLLFRVYSDLGLANRLPPAVNLVMSNVPGPPVPVYCGGARLVGLYPLGPIFDGAARQHHLRDVQRRRRRGRRHLPGRRAPARGLGVGAERRARRAPRTGARPASGSVTRHTRARVTSHLRGNGCSARAREHLLGVLLELAGAS